jgi:hypothetical protein
MFREFPVRNVKQPLVVIARSQRVRADARPDDRLRDEAIHKCVSGGSLDCFALLAMTSFIVSAAM